MPEPTKARVVAALAVVYLVWGSTYLAIKIGLDGLPPMLLAGSRFALAGVVMLTWAAIRHRRRTGGRLRPTARQWRAATITGALMLVGGNGAVTVAEQHLDSGLAALLVASVPLWIALLDRLRYGQRLSPLAIAGLVIGFGGVALLVRPDAAGQLGPSLLVVAGALAWAIGSLYTRGAALPSDNVTSTAMQMTAASVVFLTLSVLTGEPARVEFAAITWSSFAVVGYLAAFGSILAFTAYTWLIRTVPASTVATYAYVNPVVAVVLGWLVLGERLTTPTLVAAILVVTSVALIIGAKRRPPSRSARSTAATASAIDHHDRRVPVEA